MTCKSGSQYRKSKKGNLTIHIINTNNKASMTCAYSNEPHTVGLIKTDAKTAAKITNNFEWFYSMRFTYWFMISHLLSGCLSEARPVRSVSEDVTGLRPCTQPKETPTVNGRDIRPHPFLSEPPATPVSPPPWPARPC